MKGRTKWIAGTLALLGIGGLGFAVTAARGEDEPPRTVTVTRGDVVDRALAVGRIEPRVEVGVKSQISGVVRRQFAEPGEHVRAGTPLLELRPNPTPLELVEARRNLELRQIELSNLEKRRERLARLRESDYVSAEEFEEVDRSWEEARLQVRMARERLGLLEEGRVPSEGGDVETVIRAPIDGFILEQTVEIGDPVVPLTTFQEGTVLMTMAEMDDLLFRGTVDEIDVGRLREGMEATIEVGALPESGVTGTLETISLKGKEEEQATRFPLEIVLEAREETLLRAGYSANAEIVIERREGVVTIPERLVDTSGEDPRVTLLLPDGTTEERVIDTGLSDGITVEVVSGLEEGDRVVEPEPREIS